MGNGHRPTIVFDFDGVIHGHGQGWGDGTIYDDPVPGIHKTLKELSGDYDIVIQTARISDSYPDDIAAQLAAMKKWLKKHNLWRFITTIKPKPIGLVYIDDRGYRFEGEWDSKKTTRIKVLATETK